MAPTATSAARSPWHYCDTTTARLGRNACLPRAAPQHTCLRALAACPSPMARRTSCAQSRSWRPARSPCCGCCRASPTGRARRPGRLMPPALSSRARRTAASASFAIAASNIRAVPLAAALCTMTPAQQCTGAIVGGPGQCLWRTSSRALSMWSVISYWLWASHMYLRRRTDFTGSQ